MDANSFLMGGGGAPTAKFPTPGTVIGGRITEPPQLEQQRDIKTGEKKFWKDGDPMMQLVVTVQTDLRDPAIEDDNGKRRLFVKGQMKNAVSDAVRQAGGRGLEVGGTLHVRFTHELPASGPGMSPPKQYEARYITAASAELGVAAPTPAAAPTPQQAPLAPPAAPAPQQGGDPWATAAPAPVPAGVNPVTGEINGQRDEPPF